MDREIIKKVASELGLPEKLVERTYSAYWRALREYISSRPFKEDLTEEEFNAMQPNVNIPAIGKLYVTYDRYKSMKKLYNTRKDNSNASHKKD